jgi:hypothetical protein
MGGRILIFDNATGNGGFGIAGNYVDLNYKPANTAPTPNDIVLYGSTTYTVTEWGTSSQAGLSPAAEVFAPGANVTFFETHKGGAEYTPGSLILPFNSHVRFDAATVAAGNVLIGRGSTLTLAPDNESAGNAIGNLWNEGGTLLDYGNLQLGGPGFIQTSDITPGETEVHSGISQWINLGNIVQGSHPEALAFKLFNDTSAPEIGSLIGSAGDGGFAPVLPRVPVGAAAGQESGPWGAFRLTPARSAATGSSWSG